MLTRRGKANLDGGIIKRGKTLRHTFADTVLREMLEKVEYGNIVIELR